MPIIIILLAIFLIQSTSSVHEQNTSKHNRRDGCSAMSLRTATVVAAVTSTDANVTSSVTYDY